MGFFFFVNYTLPNIELLIIFKKGGVTNDNIVFNNFGTCDSGNNNSSTSWNNCGRMAGIDNTWYRFVNRHFNIKINIWEEEE